MANKKENLQVVGSVHLYGTTQSGFGYLAFTRSGRDLRSMVKVGGEDSFSRQAKVTTSGTEAFWRGMEDIKDALEGRHVPRPEVRGLVEIHIDLPSGPRMAVVELHKAWPYFGDLKWQAGPVYEISAEEILKHAEPIS